MEKQKKIGRKKINNDLIYETDMPKKKRIEKSSIYQNWGRKILLHSVNKEKTTFTKPT